MAVVLRWLAVLTVSLGALIVGLFRIDVPYPWADESATVIAVQRSWSGLLILSGGIDAPLVPYYLLTKAWVSMLPGLPVLVAARSLSAVAGALTLTCLVPIVARKNGLALAVTSSVLLIAMPAFTRYSQDARPYALFALTATASWLAWLTWRRPDQSQAGRWAKVRDTLPYLASLAVLAMSDLFGLFHWVAQGLAELTTPGLASAVRRRRVLWAAAVMISALVLTSFVVVLAALRGHGPTADHGTDYHDFVYTYGDAINVEAPYASAWLLTALAVVAVISPVCGSWVRRRYSEVTRIAGVWFAVPVAFNFALALVYPNLLRARYLHPALVPLAVLAAVGLFVLAEALMRLLKRTGPQLLGAALAAAVTVGSIAGLLALNQPAQVVLRDPAGHGNDFAPALRLLDDRLAANPDLPLIASGRTGAAILLVVRHDLGARNLAFVLRGKSAVVWPAARRSATVLASLAGKSTVIWLLTKAIAPEPPTTAPDVLGGSGFVIGSVADCGDWWVVDLQR
jgi:hypothetical protein